MLHMLKHFTMRCSKESKHLRETNQALDDPLKQNKQQRLFVTSALLQKYFHSAIHALSQLAVLLLFPCGRILNKTGHLDLRWLLVLD
jgi:hypothetical protein